jgi:signal transduction histidine kinase
MTGRGGLTQDPKRRLGLVLAVQLLWLGAVCGLGWWWARVVLIQGRKIEELERQAGMAATAEQWLRTQRMVWWESVTFFVLVLALSGFMFWLYYRELWRVRSLQAFFASVTHELRTPLTSIRLQAESIGELVGSEKQGEPALVRRLLEDTLRLESQVERTLELARVEGGGPVFTQPLRLRPWVDRVLETWTETYGDRLEVRTRLGEDVSVLADTAAVQVILKNVLENAIRHGRRERVRVTLDSERRDGGYAVILRDDGEAYQGDVTRLGRIFEKGPSSQGAGVGLYLVRVLMERMGGRAEFRAGSGFEVALWFRGGQADGR